MMKMDIRFPNLGPLCKTFILLMTVVVTVSGTPKFTTTSQTKTVPAGSTVVFQCSLTDLGTADVVWIFVKHKQQLSRNGNTHTTDPRFSIVRPQGGVGSHFNLELTGVRASDAGSYRCAVSGSPNLQQTSSLKVTGVTVPTTPSSIPSANFTDCCVKNKVSSKCLPVCHPSSLDLNTFDPWDCATDLPKLLLCGADGSNHAPCCTRRFLPALCLDFCINSPPSQLDNSHLVCLNKSRDIIACFEEGQITLPGPPVAVTGRGQERNKIAVSWQTPRKNGNTVTGYKVFYTKDQTVITKSTGILGATSNTYVLTDLDTNAKYFIFVVAINKHGASLPSYTVAVYSGQTNVKGSGSNLTECCTRRGVSKRCVSTLCGSSTRPPSPSAAMNCLTDVTKAYACLRGERNNTACCKRSGMPDKCLPLCGGSLPALRFDLLQCFVRSHVTTIATCAQLGSANIPSSPSNVILDSVKSSTAQIKWSTPMSNKDKVKYYVVQYKPVDGPYTTVTLTSAARTAVLTGLRPGTLYNAEVIAKSAAGASMPSYSVVFLTYPKSVPVDISGSAVTPTAAPHNETACCVKQNVPSKCLPICDYNADVGSVIQNNLAQFVSCSTQLGNILACGTDGRDHTPCCAQVGLPDTCLPMCRFNKETAKRFVFNTTHLQCVGMASRIMKCMKEGVGNLPSEPTDMSFGNVTTNTIMVSWKPPVKKASTVTSYIVEYMPDESETWIRKKVRRSPYIIQDLRPDTQYTIRLYAVNSKGSSLPTLEQSVYTQRLSPVLPPMPPMNISNIGNITECCQKKQVSSGCLHLCSDTTFPDSIRCSNDIPKLLECAADGRNHQTCCADKNVPDNCLSLCTGKAPAQQRLGMIICLGYMPQVLSCFKEGRKNLPSPPTSFLVRHVKARYVEFSWKKPEKNGDKVKYDIFYKQSDSPNFSNKKDVTSPYRLEQLQSYTQYDVYIVARNSHGESMPSPAFTVWTLEENAVVVTVQQIPEGVLKEQQSVDLVCRATGSPPPTVYWTRGKKRVDRATYSLRAITKADTGKYTCVANNAVGGVRTADLYLQIRYKPEVTITKRQVFVEPDRGSEALLVCQFRGYPRQVRWMRGTKEIPPSGVPGRFFKTRILIEDEGVIELKLTVINVRKEDYGMYVCIGSNDAGTANGSVTLANPRQNPRPTFKPAPKQPNITVCCQNAGVHPLCMPACSFDIDLTKLAMLPNPLQCTVDLPKLIKCGADGRDHSQCCSYKNIMPKCLPFCAGVIPKGPAEETVKCLAHVTQIVSCMEEGNYKIPTMPQNVVVQIVDGGYIRVSWSPPVKNRDFVSYYEVHYVVRGLDRKRQVNKYVRQVNLDGIHSFRTYQIYMVATNHHGSSHPTARIPITTGDLRPSEPTNLRGLLIAKKYIKVAWGPPERNVAGVLLYKIFYRPIKATKYFTNTTNGYQFRLQKLLPKTTYEIYVVATSQHYSSPQSKGITITTGDFIPEPGTPGHPGKQKGNMHSVGIGVGVAFLIIVVIIAVVASLFWYFRMKRKQPELFKETVAFENPGYATTGDGHISGLPEEPLYADPNLQPNNGKVRLTDIEPGSAMKSGDNQSDQGYATLSQRNGHPSQQDYATLAVTQLDPVDSKHVDLGFDDRSHQV